MIAVPGYTSLQIIHQSPQTLVYSARRARDGEKVILRQLRPEIASPDLVARYRKEFELLKLVNSPFVAAVHDLVEIAGSPILVLENIQGESLARLIPKRTIEVQEAIAIAIAMAEGLDSLHGQNIIHKNIHPGNIIYNPGTGALRIIDLGIAQALGSPTVRIEAGTTIEGSLPYLAPEQTGRMNRTIDYRADFYSFGVTLYELLTGTTPFLSEDLLQLVYHHIATMPLPPHEVNPGVPAGLGRIVMKLLAKMPEDRYQSTFAIKQDLTRYLELLAQQPEGRDAGFEVALDDVSEQLNIPERLIERDDALEELQGYLAETAAGGTRLVVVTGAAGIGKSALIRELQKEVMALGGYLASGKHSLMSAARPYATLSSAFGDLIRQILARPDIRSLKERIATAIEGNEHLLVDIIPELKLLLGDVDGQSPETLTPPLESRHRLIKSLAGLIGAISSEGKPFVFSIENLHWIDNASLELFTPLLTDQRIPYLMLVCTYRPGELERGDETRRTIASIANDNPLIKRITLDNLSGRAVAMIVSDSLYRPVEETIKLAEIIYAKTNGNPLAVREFIATLNQKGIIFFDRQHREWEWDLGLANQEPPSENVSAMLADKIRHLEPNTAQVLKIAACIGEEFDLDTIRNISGLSSSETTARLLHAVREGYLVYKPVTKTNSHSRHIGYQFSHERIQQAAYLLLTTNQRRNIHTRIGASYLDNAEERSAENIFEIVNQLNNSFESPDSTYVDSKRLADLNLAAGRKAKKSAAFQSSFKYFKTAIALYGQNVWAQYELSLDMHLEAAESAYLCGDHQQLDILIERALRHGKNALDLSRIYEVKLKALIAFNDLEQALAIGHEVLRLLGVHVPRKPGLMHTLAIIVPLLLKTRGLSETRFASTRPMTDPNHLAAMRVLMILCQAGYLSGSDATTTYILKMTQISLTHGMAPESSFAYPMFGAVLISYFGTIDIGYRLGVLASGNLNESNKELHCKTLTLVNNFIFVWKHNIRDSLEALTSAYRIGMETGDIEFAVIAAITGSANAFLLGHDLNSLESILGNYNQKARDFNQTPTLNVGLIYQQAIRNLTQPCPTPWLLEGEVYSESHLIQFQNDNADESSLANLYMIKLFLAILFSRDDHALAFANEARKNLRSIVSSPVVVFFVVYEALACIRNMKGASALDRFRLTRRIWRNRRLLRKWAHHAPQNVLHGLHLVEAEYSRTSGNIPAALDHYDKAIALSTENGFLKEHGLANELAGRFHLAAGKQDLGIFYIRRARSSYVRWGAMTKVSALGLEFPELADPEFVERRSRNMLTPTGAGGAIPVFRGYGDFLDLGSVIKASQVLSGEIILDSLIERLMHVALENAGAHSASLILAQDDELNVEITTRFNGTSAEHTRGSAPITSSKSLPVSVIQYVARTREDLVLNDAMNEDIFTQDEYIVSQHPKSILCVPILSKSHLIGVLYLENNQTTAAFTRDRVAILKLLASQSAIAIENAKLYQQLADSRNKYLSLYQNAVEGIFELDSQGNMTNVNPAAAQLLGFASTEDMLRNARFDPTTTFVHSEDVDKLTEILAGEGRVVGYELLIRRSDGQPVWVALSAQAFTVADNPGDYRIEGSIIDITERKLREDAEQATRIAEAATLSKSKFLANMSHEIRTPMNAIVGYTDLALQTDLTQQQASYLETIRNSSNHLLRVVNDILDLSKVESGKLELLKVPFDLQDIFTDLKNLFGLVAQERGLAFNLPSPATLIGAEYTGDPVRIGQVLINLVSNALKFTDQGEISVHFEPAVLPDGRVCLNFTVSDTGVGIDSKDLEYIFESFAQGEITSRNTGTGLGLAISKSLVEMMQGHIHAVSEKGKGATFCFGVIVEPCREQPVTASLERADPISRRLQGNRILLVEDNRINQDLAREVLSQSGLDITVADDGKQALEILEKQSFVAVLMDIRMPVMDGIEAVRQLRTNPALASLPVIALSAGVLSNEVEEALTAGFDHYLAKPIDFVELMHLLEQVGCKVNINEQHEGETPTSGKIRGIDFAPVLRNHNNDRDLLCSLMDEFIRIYQSSDRDLHDLVMAGDLVRAERLAHNVAGVSGSFGALDVMETARKIEHKLNAGDTDITMPLAEYRRRLFDFIDAINQFQLVSQPAQQTASGSAGAV